jgi:dipeptidyl aminopeptidase/acylaminoacyl peptidase
MTSSTGDGIQRDIRETPTFRDVQAHFERLYGPSLGRISGAADLDASPDGRWLAFTGTMRPGLEGAARSRVAVVAVADGTVSEVAAGANSDRLPRWSPTGTSLAFLGDRQEEGRFQLNVVDYPGGEVIHAPGVPGTVEYFAWRPDGAAILLGVAGPGADLAGAQGSRRATAGEVALPAWMPTVEGGATESRWRRLWLYDLRSGGVSRVSPEHLNIWEACWAGPSAVAAIASESPYEGAWYDAPMVLIDVATGGHRTLLRSHDQLGLPASSPSGRRLTIVEAVSSDRGVVAGELILLDPARAEARRLDTGGVDVGHSVFIGEDRLFFMGLRGLRSVAGHIELESGERTETWESDETTGYRFPAGAPLPGGGFAGVLESYARPQAITVFDAGGSARTVASFSDDGTQYLSSVAGTLERVAWRAEDGLEIEGLLATPPGGGPHALVVDVHGGPVGAWRNRWSMGYQETPLLVSRGYAVLHPNPRGSAGRGRDFARQVVGDMGGADAQDILAGVRALVDAGRVDGERVGVMGGSYGGFMSAWLVTQTEVFKAAVPYCPTTNWYSQHNGSNIPDFDTIFLGADAFAPGGRFFERSPVMFANRVKTPVFLVAGAEDNCTPPAQAVEFHHALLEHGAVSELAIYPDEGHGVRKFPAVIDVYARIVDWFERYMPATPPAAEARGVAAGDLLPEREDGHATAPEVAVEQV